MQLKLKLYDKNSNLVRTLTLDSGALVIELKPTDGEYSPVAFIREINPISYIIQTVVDPEFENAIKEFGLNLHVKIDRISADIPDISIPSPESHGSGRDRH